jgi:hypothetical protein
VGRDLNNPNAPFFHLTATGLRALANATRDPSNPAGYLKHLDARATLDPVAKAYLGEGLDCYVAGLFKASAVMVGVAAESTILGLRDVVLAKLEELGKPIARELKGWQIRPITRALTDVFDAGIDAKDSPRAEGALRDVLGGIRRPNPRTTLPVFNYLNPISDEKKELVDLISASWNPFVSWLRQVDLDLPARCRLF